MSINVSEQSMRAYHMSSTLGIKSEQVVRRLSAEFDNSFYAIKNRIMATYRNESGKDVHVCLCYSK